MLLRFNTKSVAQRLTRHNGGHRMLRWFASRGGAKNDGGEESELVKALKQSPAWKKMGLTPDSPESKYMERILAYGARSNKEKQAFLQWLAGTHRMEDPVGDVLPEEREDDPRITEWPPLVDHKHDTRAPPMNEILVDSASGEVKTTQKQRAGPRSTEEKEELERARERSRLKKNPYISKVRYDKNYRKAESEVAEVCVPCCSASSINLCSFAISFDSIQHTEADIGRYVFLDPTFVKEQLPDV